jgi:hypothetical protein
MSLSTSVLASAGSVSAPPTRTLAARSSRDMPRPTARATDDWQKIDRAWHFCHDPPGYAYGQEEPMMRAIVVPLAWICSTMAIGCGGVPPSAETTNALSPVEGHAQSLREAYQQLRQAPAKDALTCALPFELRSAANQLYVSAELDYSGPVYGMLRARSSTASAWEHFVLCYDGASGTYSLRSAANGDYVSAEIGYYAGRWAQVLRARATSVGSWEQFYLDNYPDYFTLRSAGNGRYVSALVSDQADPGMLSARASSVGAWEQFY